MNIEKETENIPNLVIESQENGEIVPIEDFKEKLRERLIYSVERAEKFETKISKALDETISNFVATAVWHNTKLKFQKYSKENPDSVEELLDLVISLPEKVAYELPANYVAVKNPHEFYMLMSECEKYAVNVNSDSVENEMKHELHHWLPIIESPNANALFGVRFVKYGDKPAEYVPIVLPYGEFTLRSFLATITGPEKINDLSNSDKLMAAKLLQAILESEGDAEKMSKSLVQILDV